MSFKHVTWVVVGVAAVSFSAIFIRIADAPSLTLAMYRNVFAAAVVLPLALIRRRGELRRMTGAQLSIAVVSGGLLALHFGTWIASLSYTSIAASVVLVTMSPILIAFASRLFFGERVAGVTWVGILVGVVGAAVVSGGDLFGISARAALGDLLALAGAVAVAGYFLAGRRLRREISLLAYVAVVYSTCALVLFVVVAASGTPMAGFSGTTWAMFVLQAAVPHLLGHTVFNYLLRDLSATVVAISVMGEPVGSTLLGLAFFGEVPPWTAVAGGALILLGIYVAVTVQGRKERAPAGGFAVPVE